MKEKKFEKRKKLLDAAIEEFSVEFFDTASLNRILEKSEVGKGTFYYHFENKIKLYEAVIDELLKMKKDFLLAKQSELGESAKNNDIFSFLYEQGVYSAVFVESYPVLKELIQRIAHEPNKDVRKIFLNKSGGGAEDFISPHVKQAVASGIMRTDFPEEFIIELLAFLFNNFSAIFTNEPGGIEETNEAVLEKWKNYIDFIKNGLSKNDDKAET